jgi:hypothetical protein
LARDGQTKRIEHETSLRFFIEAIAAEHPSDVRSLYEKQSRYNAACAAALLADYKEGAEARRLRGQAISWLRDDLAAWQDAVEKGMNTWMIDPADSRTKGVSLTSLAARVMRHWQQDEDFASVRGPDALAKLSEAERQDWQKLWTDVAALLARADDKAAPEEKSPVK